MPEIDYILNGDASGLKEELDRANTALIALEDKAEKAGKGLNELQKAKLRTREAAKALTKEERKQAKATSDAAKATKKATTAQKAAHAAEEKRSQELKQGLNAVLGDQVNKVADLTTAFGPMAIGGAAAAVTLAGMAAAAVGMASALFSAGAATVGLVREMDGFSAEVDSANDALDSLAATTEGLKGSIATEIAPSMERIVILLTAMGLAATDAFETLADGTDLAAEGFARFMNFGLNPANEAFLTMFEAMVAYNKLLGREVSPAIEEYISAQRRASAHIDGTVAGLGHLEDALGGYIDEAKAGVQSMDDLAAAEKAALDAATASIDEAIRAGDERQRVADDAVRDAERRAAADKKAAEEKAKADEAAAVRSWQATQNTWDNMVAYAAWRSEQRTAEEAEEAEHQKNLTASRDAHAWTQVREQEAARIAGIAAVRDAAIDAAAMVAAAVVDGLADQREAWIAAQTERVDGMIAELEGREDLTEKEAQLLVKLEADRETLAKMEFKRQKAAAMGTIMINTAAAMLSAAALTPLPLGLPFVVAAAGLGATQLAIAGAQQGPKHDGGAIQQFGAPSANRDEVDIRALDGEFVMNRRATEGNRGALEEMNRSGGSTSGSGGSSGSDLDAVSRALASFVAREMDGDGELGRKSRTLPSARSAYR